MEDYTASADTRVYKVHGSVNWAHPIPSTQVRPEIIDGELRALIASESPNFEISEESVLQHPG